MYYVWLHSSVGIASHQYTENHGSESRWSRWSCFRFLFFLNFLNCFKMENLLWGSLFHSYKYLMTKTCFIPSAHPQIDSLFLQAHGEQIRPDLAAKEEDPLANHRTVLWEKPFCSVFNAFPAPATVFLIICAISFWGCVGGASWNWHFDWLTSWHAGMFWRAKRKNSDIMHELMTSD